MRLHRRPWAAGHHPGGDALNFSLSNHNFKRNSFELEFRSIRQLGLSGQAANQSSCQLQNYNRRYSGNIIGRVSRFNRKLLPHCTPNFKPCATISPPPISLSLSLALVDYDKLFNYTNPTTLREPTPAGKLFPACSEQFGRTFSCPNTIEGVAKKIRTRFHSRARRSSINYSLSI